MSLKLSPKKIKENLPEKYKEEEHASETKDCQGRNELGMLEGLKTTVARTR